MQASCFSCCKCYCFKCSLVHAQQNKDHYLLEMEDSVMEISERAKEHLKALHNLKDFILMSPENDSVRERKLQTERFQKQLDEITSWKKQTFAIVDKFFEEISLEIVNIWEMYLKKFSGANGTV